MHTDDMTTKNTGFASTYFDYQAAGLSDDEIASLEACRSTIASLGRRTTEQSFDLGHELALAFDLVPEGAFGKWVKAVCGFTDRSARNYVSVHKRLGDYRQRFIEIGAAPTVLFELTKAEPEQIEQALKQAQETGRLQVRDIKLILQGEGIAPNPDAVDPYDFGGLAGLRNLCLVKMRTDIHSLQRNLTQIISSIEKALHDNAKGKRLNKSKLAGDLCGIAMCAQVELGTLGISVASKGVEMAAGQTRPEFPKGSSWELVRLALARLSNERAWPIVTELKAWLEQEILPSLQWAMAKADPGLLEIQPKSQGRSTAVAPLRTKSGERQPRQVLSNAVFGELTSEIEQKLNVQFV